MLLETNQWLILYQHGNYWQQSSSRMMVFIAIVVLVALRNQPLRCISLSLSFFLAITNATIHHHQCHHHKMTVIAMLSSGGTFAFIIVSHS